MDLISALGADDNGLFAIADGNVVSEKMAEGDMMSTVKTELLSFQAFHYFSQGFGILVCFFLLFGHDVLQSAS